MAYRYILIKRCAFVFGLVLLSLFANAQYINLSGKVTDAQNATPLVNAEVYLANTTIRAITDANGNYTIKNLPAGTYELIAWCLGHETRSMELVAVSKDQSMNIVLNTKIIQLDEVTITDISDRKQNLARFKREFIGSSYEAENCKILNEDLLSLRFNKKTETLTAKADGFLELINPMLGYKLRFLISEFWVDYKNNHYHYRGSVIFEELAGTAREKDKWIKTRNEVYNGSFRHFITALALGRSKKSGFLIKKLTRTPNSKRPPENLILSKIKQFRYIPNNKPNNDSLNKWGALRRLPAIVEVLEKGEVADTAILKPGKLPQTHDLAFKGYLYVIYKNKSLAGLGGFSVGSVGDLYRFSEAGDSQISAISMTTPEQSITFKDNGIQLTKSQLFNEGTWGANRILELLPHDFIPDIK